MTTLTQELATDGQRKLLARIAADAGEKSVLEFTGLTKDGAEVAKGNPEFAKRIREATAAALLDLAVTDKYKNEEVKPRWPYPATYKRNTIEQQIDILRSAANFPFINPDPAIKYYREVYGSLAQPEWVEGPFIIMPTSTFKRHCFPDADGAELLCSAVNLGIEAVLQLACGRNHAGSFPAQGPLCPDVRAALRDPAEQRSDRRGRPVRQVPRRPVDASCAGADAGPSERASRRCARGCRHGARESDPVLEVGRTRH